MKQQQQQPGLSPGGVSTKTSRTTTSTTISSGSGSRGGSSGSGSVREKSKHHLLQSQRQRPQRVAITRGRDRDDHRLVDRIDSDFDDSSSSKGGVSRNSDVFDGYDTSLNGNDTDDDDDTDDEFDESKLLDFDAGDYYGLQAQARLAEGARAQDKG